MTYRTLIEQAKTIPPGDTRAANNWLLRLADVLKAGELMPSERSYLYRLRRVWRKRAAGEDSRWNVHGSRAGARPTPPPIAPLVPPQPRPVPNLMQALRDSLAPAPVEVPHEAVGATQAPRRDSTPAGKPSLPLIPRDAPSTPWPGVNPNKGVPETVYAPPTSSILDKYR